MAGGMERTDKLPKIRDEEREGKVCIDEILFKI